MEDNAMLTNVFAALMIPSLGTVVGSVVGSVSSSVGDWMTGSVSPAVIGGTVTSGAAGAIRSMAVR